MAFLRFLAILLLACCQLKQSGAQVALSEIQSESDEQKRSLCTLCDITASLHRIELSLNPHHYIIKDCAYYRKKGFTADGVYYINPDGHGSFPVRCDMTTTGGGWTIFQRRMDGSVDFYRGWQDYRRGFGDMKGEFWLGLDKIHQLAAALANNVLRIDMEDTSGAKRYATYTRFSVSSESNKYRLNFGTYSGNAGDSLSYQKGCPFTTKDADNDQKKGTNCAKQYKGAWWYASCHTSNLNGRYHLGKHSSHADGVNWEAWKGYNYSLKKTEMKFRPASF